MPKQLTIKCHNGRLKVYCGYRHTSNSNDMGITIEIQVFAYQASSVFLRVYPTLIAIAIFVHLSFIHYHLLRDEDIRSAPSSSHMPKSYLDGDHHLRAVMQSLI